MARGKKSATPKELVRLTPGQFSAAVAGVVLLCSVALATGYYLGLKGRGQGNGVPFPEDGGKTGMSYSETEQAPVKSSSDDSMATTITFYSALVKGEKKAASRKKEQRNIKATAKEKKRSVPAVSAAGGGIVVQVASYQKREKAREMLKTLVASGYSGTVITADLGPRGVWHRVRLGPFRNEKDAGKVLAVLKEERSIKGFIVR